MKAAKIDRSGIFDTVAAAWVRPPAPHTVTQFQLSSRGLVFRSDRPIELMAEMSVEFELPALPGAKPRRIQCSGVVVDCEPSPKLSHHTVSLLFLDLDESAFGHIQRASKLSRWIIPQPLAALISARV
ncbi:MAG: hypothetical protein HZA91_03275 [Verrucomicrobia bacterium]|nr:hypothetical protein [Verrucomicrobiota bacterium]